MQDEFVNSWLFKDFLYSTSMTSIHYFCISFSYSSQTCHARQDAVVQLKFRSSSLMTTRSA